MISASDPKHPKNRYQLLEKIGKGGYGYVCKARDTMSDKIVAIKIINLEDAGDEMEDINQEIAVMSNINCTQLTKYFTSHVVEANLWIVMEYLEAGALLDIIKAHGPLSEPFVAYIMKELLTALVYLHSERKIHRDVKAGNILVSGEGNVKLADFGVTGQLTDSIDKRSTKIGTPFWMAPEVISQSRYDGCADVWSAGITAIELSKGAPPYANKLHPFQATLLIPRNPAPLLEGDFSPEFKNFVATCLVKDPAQRPPSSVLLRHPFVCVEKPKAWSEFIEKVVRAQQSKPYEGGVEKEEEEGDDWNFTVKAGDAQSDKKSEKHSGSDSSGSDSDSSSGSSSSSSSSSGSHSSRSKGSGPSGKAKSEKKASSDSPKNSPHSPDTPHKSLKGRCRSSSSAKSAKSSKSAAKSDMLGQISALKRENARLRQATGPYLQALNMLAVRKSAPPISAAIGGVGSSSGGSSMDSKQFDEYLKLITDVSTGASGIFGDVVWPVLHHLHSRMGTPRAGKPTPVDVLNVLTVALAAVDAAPSDSAVEGSTDTGAMSLDLLTLLTAYMQEELENSAS